MNNTSIINRQIYKYFKKNASMAYMKEFLARLVFKLAT